MPNSTAVSLRSLRVPSRWSVVAAAVIAALALLPPGAATAASVGAPAPSSSLGAGRNVFVQNCASCHGPQGSGGLSFGSVRAADIRGGHLRALHPRYTRALLERAIADGVGQEGKPLNAAMPRWKGILSAQERQQVVAYLWSLHTTPPVSTPHPVHSAAVVPFLEGIVMLGLIAGTTVATKRWGH